MSLLTVNGVSKKNGEDFLLHDISFMLKQNQKIAIAGETGSGKTTLMRIIAGIAQADSGTVFFEGQKVIGTDAKRAPVYPGIAYLSQHFELNNNYRVEELLAYANRLTEQQSAELYRICHIDHLLKRWTQTLSGGEKQRVALARLLTEQPKILLLDEPFSNAGLIHRNVLRTVIDNIWEQIGIACILISHNPEDILPWADEVLVMKEGGIVQKGTPKQIYEQPINRYVAGLFGKYNVVNPDLAAVLQSPVHNIKGSFLRPEDIIITPVTNEMDIVVIKNVLYMGGYYEVQAITGDQILVIYTSLDNLKIGDKIDIKRKE